MDAVDPARSLSDQAYLAIQRRIITLRIPPGSVIDERVLMAELGLGRTPVREALSRLAVERLVVVIPRKGTFAANIGMRDLQWTYELRIVLEGLAARLAAERANEAQIALMESIVGAWNARDADSEGRIRADMAFHMAIYEAADSPFLRDDAIAAFALALRIFYALSLHDTEEMSAAGAHHRWTLDAIKARDAARAEESMKQHIRDFREHIEASIAAR